MEYHGPGPEYEVQDEKTAETDELHPGGDPGQRGDLCGDGL